MKTKKIIAGISAFALALTTLGVSALAADTTVHVKNYTELAAFRDSIKDLLCLETNYVLEIDADIDMSSDTDWDGIVFNGYPDIKNVGSSYGLTINGNNHTIKGLTINHERSTTSSTDHDYGFVKNNNGVLKVNNLTFEDAKVNAKDCGNVGILAGQSNYNNITNVDMKNCSVTGLSAAAYVGYTKYSYLNGFYTTCYLTDCDLVNTTVTGNHHYGLFATVSQTVGTNYACNNCTADSKSKTVWYSSTASNGVSNKADYITAENISYANYGGGYYCITDANDAWIIEDVYCTPTDASGTEFNGTGEVLVAAPASTKETHTLRLSNGVAYIDTTYITPSSGYPNVSDGSIYGEKFTSDKISYEDGVWHLKDGFTFDTTDGIALYASGNTNLSIDGEVHITGRDFGIYCNGAITIQGTGTLYVENSSDDYFAQYGDSSKPVALYTILGLTVNGAKIDAVGTSGGIDANPINLAGDAYITATGAKSALLSYDTPSLSTVKIYGNKEYKTYTDLEKTTYQQNTNKSILADYYTLYRIFMVGGEVAKTVGMSYKSTDAVADYDDFETAVGNGNDIKVTEGATVEVAEVKDAAVGTIVTLGKDSKLIMDNAILKKNSDGTFNIVKTAVSAGDYIMHKADAYDALKVIKTTQDNAYGLTDGTKTFTVTPDGGDAMTVKVTGLPQVENVIIQLGLSITSIPYGTNLTIAE